MLEVEMDNKKYLCIVIESLGDTPEGCRTVISIQHDQGLELHRQLTEYYGRLEGAKMECKRGFFHKLFS